MPNPVVHFEILTRDPDALGEFYKKIFDWDVDAMHPSTGAGDVAKYIMARPDGKQPPPAGINGGIGGLPPDYDGHVTFYIAVDDVGAMLDQIEKSGGTRIMGPERVPDGPEIGLFKDPAGHTIGLVKNEPM